jgi:hypothetical protein
MSALGGYYGKRRSERTSVCSLEEKWCLSLTLKLPPPAGLLATIDPVMSAAVEVPIGT